METKTIKNLAVQVRGVSYRPEDLHDSLDETSVILLRANNIDEGRINFDDVVFVDRKKVSPEQFLKKGDILICASSGSKNLVGKAAPVDFEKEVTFGAFCKVVRPNSANDADYISMFFQSSIYRRKISSAAIGANINNIRNEHIDQLSIKWPSFEERCNAVKMLSKAAAIIQRRRKELQQLDDLIKARFVETFGDVKTNVFGWEKCTFQDVTTRITDGEHGTVPRVDKDNGILYFMARNITKDGLMDLSETSYVPEEVHKKIYKRCNPEYGDLLLVCVGATIGKCTLVPKNFGEFSMARSVALLKPSKEKVTSQFLINLLKSDSIQRDIENCSHVAAQAGLYANMIGSLDAIVPPIDLQNQFDIIVAQVDKIKSAVQKALNEAQMLFDSLMQKYFGLC